MKFTSVLKACRGQWLLPKRNALRFGSADIYRRPPPDRRELAASPSEMIGLNRPSHGVGDAA